MEEVDEIQSDIHEIHRKHKITLFTCPECCHENTDMLIALVKEIVKLEKERDGIGRHTNVSAHMESIMSDHPKAFELFQ